MEVGAVKQAFNNEVILLKKKLNQAKTQVIHKLTRKAKTLTEKKSPDHLKEKLKRKAESAVNEVLIIKKIKARDIAKFIITHTGNISDYINKPQVDNDKACARLVLHKALQDKYKFIRNRFGNIPIKDLFMSRLERRKLKKEAKEQQKNKKKGKEGKVVNSAGDWDVEDVEMSDDINVSQKEIGDDIDASQILIGSDNDEAISSDEHSGDENEHPDKADIFRPDDVKDFDVEDQDAIEFSDGTDSNLPTGQVRNDDEATISDESDDEIGNDSNNESEDEELNKLKPEKAKRIEKPKLPISSIDKIETVFDDLITKKQIQVKGNKINKIVKENKGSKNVKDGKNKNLKEKLQNRKFKKDDGDDHLEGRKIVDPFFITASGGKYLSLAEPRQPDEIKEVHKQGNRQERRAAMFGRKFKPRNDFRDNNFRSNKFDEGNRYSAGKNKNDKLGNAGDFHDRNSKFNDRNGKFNDRNSNFTDQNSKFNDNNNRFTSKNVNNQRNDDKRVEKLHPSWEAKRKLKSMSLLPSQGKKIVFEN